MQLTTFKDGLKSREFVVSLAKNPPKMMVELLLKAQKYMNAEDTLATIKDVKKSNKKRKKEDDQKGGKRECTDCQNSDGSKRKDDKVHQTVEFTLLVIPVDKILA